MRSSARALATEHPGADIEARLDKFVLRLKAHQADFPVCYYCEWIDTWSMGDEFEGSLRVVGQRFEVTCFSPEEAVERSKQIRGEWREQKWMAARLKEASDAWPGGAELSTILLIRELLGPSADENELRIASEGVPLWLSDDAL